MNKYLKVKVYSNKIEIIKKVSGIEEYKKELKNKKQDEQIWRVSSYKDIFSKITEHNEHINKRIEKTYKTKKIDKVVGNWDLSKISEKNKKLLIQHYEKEEWHSIMKIHNDLKLTDEFYCCDSYKAKIIENMKFLI